MVVVVVVTVVAVVWVRRRTISRSSGLRWGLHSGGLRRSSCIGSGGILTSVEIFQIQITATKGVPSAHVVVVVVVVTVVAVVWVRRRTISRSSGLRWGLYSGGLRGSSCIGSGSILTGEEIIFVIVETGFEINSVVIFTSSELVVVVRRSSRGSQNGSGSSEGNNDSESGLGRHYDELFN